MCKFIELQLSHKLNVVIYLLGENEISNISFIEISKYCDILYIYVHVGEQFHFSKRILKSKCNRFCTIQLFLKSTLLNIVFNRVLNRCFLVYVIASETFPASKNFMEDIKN